MRDDAKEIVAKYKSILPFLKKVVSQLDENINETVSGIGHIDKVSFRVKAQDSFIQKAGKRLPSGELKHKSPFREIQDLVGGRIVVFYKTEVEIVTDVLEKNYSHVEKREIVPDDEREFGYEGVHYIFFIPSHIYNPHKENPLLPYFFELQIKTLYQHAWAQAEHGLGYKPQVELSKDVNRKLAFLAAQSWGADQILTELIAQMGKNKN